MRSGENARQTMERYFSWGGRNMEEDLRLFNAIPGGVVVMSDDLCLMARAVGVDARGILILFPEQTDELVNCNAWMIHFMAGDLESLPAHVPHYNSYPFVCYVRGGRFDARMRIIPIHRFSSSLKPSRGD